MTATPEFISRKVGRRDGAIWVSLGLVGLGILSVAGLLHAELALGGEASSSNPLLAPALGLSSLLGSPAATCFFLLLTVWAGTAFVSGAAREAWRRIGFSLLFAGCLSVFAASLQYEGGSLGGTVAARLDHVLGAGFSTFLLSVLTLIAFLLATDWLFFQGFVALGNRGQEDRADERGLSIDEESALSRFEAAATAAPTASRIPEETKGQEFGSKEDGVSGSEPVPAVEPKAALPRTEGRSAPAPSSKHRLEPRPHAPDEAPEGAAQTGTSRRGGLRLQPEARGGSERGDHRRRKLRAAHLRHEQEALDEMLAEVRDALEPEVEQEPPSGDPLAGLQDEDLLNKASEALDEILGGGELGSLSLDEDLARPAGSESEAPSSEGQGPEDPPRVEEARPMAQREDLHQAADQDRGRDESDQARGDDEIGRVSSGAEIDPVRGHDEADQEPGRRAIDGEEAVPAADPEHGRTEADPEPATARDSDRPLRRPEDPVYQTTMEEYGSGDDPEAALEPEVQVRGEGEPASASESPTMAGGEQEFGTTEPSASASPQSPESEPGIVSGSEAGTETGSGICDDHEAGAQETGGTEDPSAHEGLGDEEDLVVLAPATRRRIRGLPDEESQMVQEALFAEEAPDPELLDRAARVLLTSRRPGPSLLQRRLDLGYAEARQILAYLEKLGAVAEPAGAGPWTPLIDLGEWEARRS